MQVHTSKFKYTHISMHYIGAEHCNYQSFLQVLRFVSLTTINPESVCILTSW